MGPTMSSHPISSSLAPSAHHSALPSAANSAYQTVATAGHGTSETSEQNVFKQQFSQYLGVLKEQIQMMDMQIKDALKQRDQYRKQCEEKDKQIRELRRRVNDGQPRDPADVPSTFDDPYADDNQDNLLECIRLLTNFRQGLSEKYQISPEDMKEVNKLIRESGFNLRELVFLNEGHQVPMLDRADLTLQQFLTSAPDQDLKLIVVHSLFLKY